MSSNPNTGAGAGRAAASSGSADSAAAVRPPCKRGSSSDSDLPQTNKKKNRNNQATAAPAGGGSRAKNNFSEATKRAARDEAAAFFCTVCVKPTRKDGGQIAHIYPAGERGPRWEDVPAHYTANDLKSIENAMFVCLGCHSKMDHNPDKFPAQVLLALKATLPAKISRIVKGYKGMNQISALGALEAEDTEVDVHSTVMRPGEKPAAGVGKLKGGKIRVNPPPR